MNSNKSLVAGVLATIGASLCCVAPLILVMLGLGGAWVVNLTKLEPIRPVMSVLAIALISIAGYQLYRREIPCETSQICSAPPVKQKQQIIFWLVSILSLGLLAFPWYANVFY